MNEAMVKAWNSVVGKYDKVYHLGDFAFGRDNIAIAARLNGQKRLIMGNHDCYPQADYLKYFHSLHGALYWKDCILTHIPVHDGMLDGTRAKLNCHGHMHSKLIADNRYFNCSVEQCNFIPINADIILERVKHIWMMINL